MEANTRKTGNGSLSRFNPDIALWFMSRGKW